MNSVFILKHSGKAVCPLFLLTFVFFWGGGIAKGSISVTSAAVIINDHDSVDFGSAIAGETAPRSFTILNTGPTALTGLSVAIQGNHGGEFTLATPPSATLAVGASTTFIVNFTPGAASIFNAAFTISHSGNASAHYFSATGTGALPEVSVSATAEWVWEDSAAPVVFTFTRTGGTGSPLAVNFSVTGAAALGADYTVSGAGTFNATGGTITIPAGSASASFTLTPVADTSPEIGEEAGMILIASAQYSVGYPDSAGVEIASEELLPGGRDRTFYPEIIGNHVSSTAIQPDGKLIIGGSFTTVNGVPRTNLARLNSDGTLDAGFVPGATNQYFPITGVLVQSDGRIVILGGITGIARLLNDGIVDPSFSSPFSLVPIKAFAQQADGKLIVSGNFTSVSGVPRNRMARLNADGTLDTTFDPGLGANDWIHCIVVQPDGQILVGGQFTTFGGQPRNCIVRLNPNGSLDGTFDAGSGASGGFPLAVLALALQPDGRVVIGGSFTGFNGQTRARIARLENNGILDPTFHAAAATDDTIYTLALQTDGKILLGGYFNTANGLNSHNVARLNADGTLDSTFQIAWGPTNGVLGITVLADGRVLSYGGTSVVDFTHSMIARRANHPAAQALAPVSGAVGQWQRSGTGPELIRVTFDLSTDGGANWTPLGVGTRIGISSGWEITGQALPMTGHLRARGIALSGHQGATSSIIEQLQAFTRAPEIVVEAPTGVPLVDGGSTYDYGVLFRPAPPTVGYGMAGFSIRNTGCADLTGLAVSFDGDHAADLFFSGPLPFGTPLAPGASRGMGITFTPGGSGTRTAAVHIQSNDGDENTFDISLTCLGATKHEHWRHTYFGSIVNAGPGADTEDPDHDGNSNALEFFAGLNPNDATSRFEVLVAPVPGSPAQRRIFFTSVPTSLGWNPTVAVKCSATLTPGSWQPLTGVIQTGLPMSFIDDPNAGGPAKFYRVEISPPFFFP